MESENKRQMNLERQNPEIFVFEDSEVIVPKIIPEKSDAFNAYMENNPKPYVDNVSGDSLAQNSQKPHR